MGLIWIITIIISLIVEALTFNLVTIWIALGALAAYIISFFTPNETIQIFMFFLVTILSLIFTRDFVKRYISKTKVKTNLDSVVGKTGTVTKKITSDETGRVKVMGKSWSAVSENNKVIKQDTKVKIIKIEGVKLIVKKEEK